MRINPTTGEIISYEDYFCPNCNAEIDAGDDYCDECDQYLGEIVQNGGGYRYTSNEGNNRKDFEQNNADDDQGLNRLCCCIFLILLIACTYFALMPSTL